MLFLEGFLLGFFSSFSLFKFLSKSFMLGIFLCLSSFRFSICSSLRLSSCFFFSFTSPVFNSHVYHFTWYFRSIITVAFFINSWNWINSFETWWITKNVVRFIGSYYSYWLLLNIIKVCHFTSAIWFVFDSIKHITILARALTTILRTMIRFIFWCRLTIALFR